AAASSPAISLSPSVGPPTTLFAVSGTGFGPSETIDVRFDTGLVGKTTTDASGGFSIKVKAPRSALPGSHQVKAKGETSGLLASTVFTVRTDWSMFRYSLNRAALNPYENVLSASNVS